MLTEAPAAPKTSPLFRHQEEGAVKLLENPSFYIADEPGCAKTRQVIEAACRLNDRGEICHVLVIAPATVRGVWADSDPDLGQIRKYAWVPSRVFEYHSGGKTARYKLLWEEPDARLSWVVTNYEFVRIERHLKKLLEGTPRETFFVLDESSYLKSRTAKQTKACKKIRAAVARAVMLNGTPVTRNPLDLWAQFDVLDSAILGKRYKNFYHFRSDYAVMGGFQMKQVIRWQNLEKLQQILAPYVIRRLKKDVLDLPLKMGSISSDSPVFREVALDDKTWTMYKQLKKEAVFELENSIHLERNAAVRIMRLAQITSGHISISNAAETVDLAPEVPLFEEASIDTWDLTGEPEVKDLSSEKLDWAFRYLTEECQARYVIVWCRWRRERERLAEMLRNNIVTKGNLSRWAIGVSELYGGQKKVEREFAVRAFSLEERGQETELRRVLLAQPHAGSLGLNLVAASEAIYLSNDYSLGTRIQSEDRCHRPGQTRPVTYTDVLATGPRGQKTIDHVIFKALRNAESLATWTSSAWVTALKAEDAV